MDMVNRSEECNQDIKEILLKDSTIIIDWNDLNQAFHQFKISYGQIPLDEIINSNKTPLRLKIVNVLVF